MTFPSPVGGVSLDRDYAPSLVFTALYGLLLPGFVYRLWDRRSRNILILGTLLCSIERLMIFTFRAVQIRDDDVDHWHSKTQTYMQITLGICVVTMAQDVVYLLRSLLVNTTYAQDIPEKRPALTSESADFVTQDQPRLRFWFRRYTDGTSFVSFLGVASGTLAGGLYTAGMQSERIAHVVMVLRHMGAALGLLLVVMLCWAAILARRLPRVKQRGASLICIHTLLLTITCTYRLSVMHCRTLSLTSTLPGSLNTSTEKTGFYIFHILPEWLSAVLLVAVNVREEFGTGPFGDWRWRDEKPKQKAKREMKEQAKRGTETEKQTDVLYSVH